ncbi:MAG: hypothetical protein QM647_11735 [Asticcacaulis sp.]|uniref:hypothetical protein n=1 Tax=Asticcacaulis sp. TaxID=1872648 RepID=UPI0039E24332
MNEPASTVAELTDRPATINIKAATMQLFNEIEATSGSVMLQQSIAIIKTHVFNQKPREGASPRDLRAEFEALQAHWQSRDIKGLQRLLVTYFKRRDLTAPTTAIAYPAY